MAPSISLLDMYSVHHGKIGIFLLTYFNIYCGVEVDEYGSFLS